MNDIYLLNKMSGHDFFIFMNVQEILLQKLKEIVIL